MDRTQVREAMLGGLRASVIGFGLWLVPAFAAALWMSVDLALQRTAAAAISARIADVIPGMYSGSALLTVGLVVVTALAVGRRAYRSALAAPEGAVATGAVVGAVAALTIVLILLAFGSLGWPSGLAVVACIGAGVRAAATGAARRRNQ